MHDAPPGYRQVCTNAAVKLSLAMDYDAASVKIDQRAASIALDPLSFPSFKHWFTAAFLDELPELPAPGWSVEPITITAVQGLGQGLGPGGLAEDPEGGWRDPELRGATASLAVRAAHVAIWHEVYVCVQTDENRKPLQVVHPFNELLPYMDIFNH